VDGYGGKNKKPQELISYFVANVYIGHTQITTLKKKYRDHLLSSFSQNIE